MIESLLDNLFKEDSFKPPEARAHLVNEHRLEFWALQKWRSQASDQQVNQWQEQCRKYKIMNTLYLYEFDNLHKAHQEIIALKGVHLLKNIYSKLEQRALSDVDILLPRRSMNSCVETLIQNGYSMSSEKKWIANDFKYILRKKTELGEITCELHTKLFYDENKEDQAYLSIKEYPIEMHLIHLCSHYAFQHSFLKIFWLIDIYMYLNTYSKKINPTRLYALSKKFKAQKPVKSCLHICSQSSLEFTELLHRFKNVSIPENKIDSKFLLNSRQSLLHLSLVKYRLHHSTISFLKYYLGWLKQRAR